MLKLKNLHVSVEGAVILNGVSLQIKPGSVHAVMGPNGSGKSTLAYSLAGHPQYPLTQGTIILNQKKINDLSPDKRAQLGLFLAFQYPVSIQGISVQNFLKSAHDAIHGKSGTVLEFRHKLHKEADKLGIKKELLARSLNDGFSGGEKKRVEVLQILTLKPKYAIFDETDSGLDIDSIKLAAAGIKSTVKKYNTGCIIITHYQRILDYLKPDYVHVMLKGKIVKSGNADLVNQLEKSGYKDINHPSLAS